MLTLDELSEHLRMRNMDLYFPRDEQRLLFESLDKTHSMRLPVATIIQHSLVQAPHPQPAQHRDDHLQYETKDILLHKIDKQRERDKLISSPRQTRRQLVRTLRNLDPHSTGYISKEKLQYALSAQYLGLNLSSDELQAAVDLCPPSSRTGEIQYDKFVRLLNIRNSDPINDPFFDAKAAGITRLKARIHQLTEQEHDEALLTRRKELLKVCMIGPGSCNSSKCFDSDRMVHEDTVTEQTEQAHLEQAHVSQEFHISDTMSSVLTPIKKDRASYRNRSTLVGTCGVGVRHEVDDSDTHSPTGHFRPAVNHPSRAKVKYPMTVELAAAHGDHRERVGGGRRRGPDHVTNWSLVREEGTSSGVNSQGQLGTSSSSPALLGDHALSVTEMTRSFSASSMTGSQDLSRHRSVQADYFTPLEYKPSMPVSRPGVIGDAMRGAMEREVRRIEH